MCVCVCVFVYHIPYAASFSFFLIFISVWIAERGRPTFLFWNEYRKSSSSCPYNFNTRRLIWIFFRCFFFCCCSVSVRSRICLGTLSQEVIKRWIHGAGRLLLLYFSFIFCIIMLYTVLYMGRRGWNSKGCTSHKCCILISVRKINFFFFHFCWKEEKFKIKNSFSSIFFFFLSFFFSGYFIKRASDQAHFGV